MAEKKRTPMVATLAGATAGMIETAAIWPMEYVKTHLQLQQRLANPLYTGMYSCAKYTMTHHGPLGFYRGLLPVLVGSIPKAGIRFGGFNLIRTYLVPVKPGEKVAVHWNLFAGTLAGAVESTFAVTPIETVKTKLIHGHKSFVAGFKEIVRTEGIRGVYKGWSATTLKQSSNQGLRFMAFTFYKDRIVKKQKLSSAEALVGGMISGMFSTVCNNPFDMLKTRMQGLHGHQYSNFFQALKVVVKNEGVMALWQGTGARLWRVVPGQGIIFMSYEKIADLLTDVL